MNTKEEEEPAIYNRFRRIETDLSCSHSPSYSIRLYPSISVVRFLPVFRTIAKRVWLTSARNTRKLKVMSNSVSPLLELKHVSVMRGNRLVLDDMSLRIEDGQHVVIMGPNGSGKSTLIKTITREIYPLSRDDSYVRVFGRDRWDVSQLRTLLGVVSNETKPFATRRVTCRDAVVSGLLGSVGLWPHQQVAPEQREKAESLLEALDVAHLADRSMSDVSSGEGRRVLIARALVHGPRALLLDEPSNSLDIFAQTELHQTMRKLAQSGIALLLITHHLPDVVPEIKRIIFLRGGRIVGDGTKEELLTKESLHKLFGCPVELVKRNGCFHIW